MSVGRVVTVGAVNIDLVMRVPQIPAIGQTIAGRSLTRHHGGKAANQAVAAGRSGGHAVFVGAIGDDDFGRAARVALTDDGVDVSELAVVHGETTGTAVILVDDEGHNTISLSAGANGTLGADRVVRALDRLRLDDRDVVVVSNEVPMQATLAALRSAQTAGARSILNPAPADGIPVEAIALADVITPNEGELAQLAATLGLAAAPSDELARAVAAEAGCAQLLVTEGERGALLVAYGSQTRIAAPAVTAVDTVGAGDTVNGVLAAGLAAGLPAAEASARAIVAASLAVTRPGARGGMPDRVELARASAW